MASETGSEQLNESPSRSLLSAFYQTVISPRKNMNQSSNSAAQPQAPPARRPLRPRLSLGPKPLSEFSSPAVPDSSWSSENFMLGAGMVIIQPSTHKIVVIYDTKDKYWFFPRGRKDMGESLETTVIREAYEESGYQVEFLPLYTPTHAPVPPNGGNRYDEPNTEPFYVTLSSWAPGKGNRKMGGEYLTSWWVGQIPENAVHNKNTGMPDEQTFTSHLCTYDQAMKLVFGHERDVLRYAWTIYVHTLEIEHERRTQARQTQIPAEHTPKPARRATT